MAADVRPVAVVVACLLLVPGAVATVQGAPSPEAGTVHEALHSEETTVEAVAFEGEGVLWRDGIVALAEWRSTTVEVEVTSEAAEYGVCLVDNATGERYACGVGTGDGPVSLSVADWPANASGRQTLDVVVLATDGTRRELARETGDVRVVATDGDIDGDGLENRRETEAGTGIRVADTDGDGLSDSQEVAVHETDPTDADTDGDGLQDRLEVNEYGTDPTSADSDGDGLADGEEVASHGTDPTAADTDGDGLSDRQEVAVYGTDPTSVDTDGDGLPDGQEVEVYGTDPTIADTDGDGLADGREVRVYETDPTTADSDDDGIPDDREVQTNGTNGVSAQDSGGLLPGTGGLDLGNLPAAALVLAGAGLVLAVAAGGWWLGRTTDPDGAGETASDHGPRAGGAGDAAVPLDDESRVKRLLDDHGGRLRQTEIVERTDWSKSKASRLLSRMAEEGQIRKIQVGRENLIASPDAAPEAAAAPFD